MGSIIYKNTPILKKSTQNLGTKTDIALFQSPSAWECDEKIIEKTFERNLEILLEKNLIDENNYDNIIQILDHIGKLKPISSFDLHYSNLCIIIVAEIIHFVSYKEKLYLSSLILYLILETEANERFFIRTEYHELINEIKTVFDNISSHDS